MGTPPQPTIYGNYSFAKNNYVWVSSACGLFESDDEGKTFAPAAIPAGHDYYNFGRFYADSSWFYISDFHGVFRRPLSGGPYQMIFSVDTAKAILANDPPPCVGIGFGTHININAIYGDGDLIVLATDAFFAVSSDGAKTWNRAKFMAGNYEISPSMDANPDILATQGNLLVRLSVDMTSSAFNSLSATGTCDSNQSVVSQATPYLGYFKGSVDHLTFNYMPSAAGMPLVTSKDSNDHLLAITEIPSSSGTHFYFYELPDGKNWSLNHQMPVASTNQSQNLNAMDSMAIFEGMIFIVDYNGTRFSNDGGNSFSSAQSYPISAYKAQRFLQTNTRLLLIADDGVRVWDNTKNEFVASSSFSSPICGSNMLVGDISAGTADNFFIANSYHETYGSSNGGKTFASISMGHVVPDESLYAGGVLYISQDQVGLRSSTDNGQTWSAPQNEFAVPGSPAVIRYSRNNNMTSTAGGTGLYYSNDGSNQMGQVFDYLQSQSSLTSPIPSALSIGKRIIAYINGMGVATIDSGNLISLKRDVRSSGGNQGIRLRMIGAKIFILADELWVSDDYGTSFYSLPNTPQAPVSIFQMGGSIYLLGLGSLYHSEDQGTSFSAWTSCLK